MPAARSRTTFIRDAARYAANCAKDGADWDGDVWPKIEGGCAIAGVDLTLAEHQKIFESWLLALPEKTAA
jgi:hypothetical protein